MASFIHFMQGSFFGQVVYHFSGRKLFQYNEEKADYVIPEKYLLNTPPSPRTEDNVSVKEDNEQLQKLHSNRIIVTWESDDDPDNPHNWPLSHKVLFISQIGFLTWSIYMGSSIYIPGEQQLMQEFGISAVVATLPLSLFVMGYGLGPMVFSPLSEHPVIGRMYVYIVTLFVFVILQIPTALSKNIGSLLILRFLSGFFASPALATGGASIGDVLSISRLPNGLALWGLSAVLGPVLGPLLGGVFAQGLSWRWTFWFELIITATSFGLLIFTFPESSQEALLYRKVQRLRKITGNEKLVSCGNLRVEKMTLKEVAIDTLWRPIKITLSEPIVLSLNMHVALVYAVLYLWFEAFPILLIQVHHFNLIQTGVGFVSVQIGVILGAIILLVFLYYKYTKPLESGQQVAPEMFLAAAIPNAVCLPAGLFIFGWTTSPNIHWIVPLIGAAISALGMYGIFQCTFDYFGMSFYRFLASVFASNNIFRSGFASAFPLFARAMYNNLGTARFPIGWGSSILGFISSVMVLIPVILYRYGVSLRARSRYAN